MKKIGIILETTRPTRIGLTIAEWVEKKMTHDLLNIDIIDLAKIDLPFLDEPEIPMKKIYTKEHTRQWSALIQQYDGFVLVFPQYNWGYPAVLKNALDFLYEEWKGKPVSTIVYGGHGGFQGFISIKLVTQGLGMYNMSVNPSLTISEEMFDENNQFIDIEHSFKQMAPQVKLVSDEFITLLY